jgi:2,6-dihydroxypseudooxynicotine hydrolase
MLEDVPLAADFERYTSAVIDSLVARPEIDRNRIGIVGRSLGGLYAIRSACADQRLRACVSWGGFTYVSWEHEPAHDRSSWQYVTGKPTEAEARDYVVASLETRPMLGDLRCPTYFLHGALDEMPVDQVDVLRELAPHAPLTLVIEDEGDHCCHNLGPVPRVQMADWLVDHLR